MVLDGLERRPTWRALEGLDTALTAVSRAAGAEVARAPSGTAAVPAAASEGVETAYVALVRALLREERADVPSALAAGLLEEDNRLGCGGAVADGLVAAVTADLELVLAVARRGWQSEAAQVTPLLLPPLERLAHEPDDPAHRGWEAAVSELAAALMREPADAVARRLLARFASEGSGAAARFAALRWEDGGLRGIPHPATAEGVTLVGVDEQLHRLYANTEALLAGAPAHNVLLYGPRGSGKSTAVRSLLPRYAGRGLRLLELPGDAVAHLPEVVEALRRRPQRFVLYVDDLSFEQGDRRYHPLKTLLEGSLTARPDNVVLYATSNRRHLLTERFSERPEPGDDDVHAWDTHNERLALADRFGLAITFPSATQRAYLGIVAALAEDAGVRGPDLDQRAIRFADWGNGYSGRTARQFIDAVLQERAAGRA